MLFLVLYARTYAARLLNFPGWYECLLINYRLTWDFRLVLFFPFASFAASSSFSITLLTIFKICILSILGNLIKKSSDIFVFFVITTICSNRLYLNLSRSSIHFNHSSTVASSAGLDAKEVTCNRQLRLDFSLKRITFSITTTKLDFFLHTKI